MASLEAVMESLRARDGAGVDEQEALNCGNMMLLRDEMENTIHQIRHLIRSQAELQAFVEGDGSSSDGEEEEEDTDRRVDVDDSPIFTEAMNENNMVIESKIRRVRIIREELLANDPTYKVDDDAAALDEFHAWEQLRRNEAELPHFTVSEVNEGSEAGMYL
jgi:hypothetical protein